MTEIKTCEFCEIDGRGQHAPRCPVQLEAEMFRLKNELAAMAGAKAAAEAETDAFMEYHEQEMQHVYGIRQAHGTAVVAIQVDRMQFMYPRSRERLEEMVKLVTIQTLEALLAGTPGREVFDRLTRELVRQRMEK